MKYEVIAFWSDKENDGMVCVKKNGTIIDSEIAPVDITKSEFLVWRKVKSFVFIHRYGLKGVRPLLVQ